RQLEAKAGPDQRVIDPEVTRARLARRDDLQAVERQAAVVARGVAMSVGARDVVEEVCEGRSEFVGGRGCRYGRGDRERGPLWVPCGASCYDDTALGRRRQMEAGLAAG